MDALTENLRDTGGHLRCAGFSKQDADKLLCRDYETVPALRALSEYAFKCRRVGQRGRLGRERREFGFEPVKRTPKSALRILVIYQWRTPVQVRDGPINLCSDTSRAL